jgi:hypothetical protein
VHIKASLEATVPSVCMGYPVRIEAEIMCGGSDAVSFGRPCELSGNSFCCFKNEGGIYYSNGPATITVHVALETTVDSSCLLLTTKDRVCATC